MPGAELPTFGLPILEQAKYMISQEYKQAGSRSAISEVRLEQILTNIVQLLVDQ